MILWCHSEAQSRLGHRTPPGRRQSKNLGEPVSNADFFHASSMRNIAKYRRYSAFRKDLTKEIAMTNFNTYTKYIHFLSYRRKSFQHLSAHTHTWNYSIDSHLRKDSKCYSLSVYKWKTPFFITNCFCYYFEMWLREEASQGGRKEECAGMKWESCGIWCPKKNQVTSPSGSLSSVSFPVSREPSRVPGARWAFSR